MILKSIIVLFIELIIFYILGTAFNRLFKNTRTVAVAGRVIEGFFLNQVLFQVMALPFIFAGEPMTTLLKCWAVIFAFLMVAGIISSRKTICQDIRALQEGLKKPSLTTIAALAIIVLMCWYVSINGEYNEDARYYIGLVNTTWTHDYMFIFNVYTGEMTRSIYLRRMLVTFEIQAAAMCRIFDIHPLVFLRVERASLNVILTAMSIYLLGNLGYARSEEKSRKSYLLIIVAFLLYWISDTTIYTNASFLLHRAYEAKAFTGNVVIYFVLYLVFYYMQTREKWCLFFLAMALWGCLALSTSALIVAVVGAGVAFVAYLVVRLIMKKKVLQGCGE